MINNTENGFSIIELLIAISILVIGLIGTATMLSTNIGSNRFSQMITVEATIAGSVNEELLAKAGNDPLFAATVANVAYDLDQSSGATTLTVQGRTYSATYSITTANPVAGVARVVTTVTSGNRSITITSFKSTI